MALVKLHYNIMVRVKTQIRGRLGLGLGLGLRRLELLEMNKACESAEQCLRFGFGL